MRKAMWVMALMIATAVAPARGEASGEVAPAESDLYRDVDGQSVANVTQVLPNSKETTTVLSGVKRIAIKGEVVIIVHGSGAVTLIPRMYLSNLTVNKRAAATP